MKTTLGTKISLITFFIIATVSTITIVNMQRNESRIINGMFKNDIQMSMNAIHYKIDLMKSTSFKLATYFAERDDVAEAVESGDKNRILSIINEQILNQLSDVEYATITDNKGIVLARTYSDKSGDSIANQHNVQAALKGTPASFVERGSEIKIAVRSSAPVYDANGNFIGIVSAGYRLDISKFVDDLKSTTGMDITVFLDDERVSTTIMKNSERQTGTKLNEKIADIVLTKGQIYNAHAEIIGEPYYSMYEPIINRDGDTIGIFFVGKPLRDILAMRRTETIITITIIIVTVIVILLIYMLIIEKMIIIPVKAVSDITVQISKGNLNISNIMYKSNDEIGALVKACEKMVKEIINQSQILSAMADADYTRSITVRSDSDVMNKAINELIYANNLLVSEIKGTAQQVSAGANEISETTITLAENNTNLQTNCMTADMLMKKSMDFMNNVTKAMTAIDESSENIKKITRVIENISVQTNILALNSAVEAAKTAEQGKGFAVISDEIRTLASRSSSAATQAEQLIESCTLHINECEEILETANKTLREVREEISKATSAVQFTASQSQQSAARAEEMSAQAKTLTNIISKYKLSEIDTDNI